MLRAGLLLALFSLHLTFALDSMPRLEKQSKERKKTGRRKRNGRMRIFFWLFDRHWAGAVSVLFSSSSQWLSQFPCLPLETEKKIIGSLSSPFILNFFFYRCLYGFNENWEVLLYFNNRANSLRGTLILKFIINFQHIYRIPFRGQVDFAFEHFRRQFRGCGLWVHHSHDGTRAYSVQRRQNPIARFAWDYWGSKRWKRQRPASHCR